MKHEIIPIMEDCRLGIAQQSRLCHCERSEAISLHHSLFLVRHSIFTTTFTFLLVLFNIAAPAYAKYGGGTGEPNDPYLIYDANQMNAIGADSNDWDKHFKLMADINLSGYTGTSFNIIGEYIGWEDPNNRPFTGVFDGNDHTISSFSYNSTGKSLIGLFGCVDDPNTVIKNLGLIAPNIDVEMGGCVGSLVGCLSGGNITNCYVEGGSVSGSSEIGGLVGRNEGTITNCYSAGSVSGYAFVGGLVGYSYCGKIMCCNSSGSVFGTHHAIGGLVGWNYGTINKSYSEGNVSGKEEVGGLVGGNRFPEPLPPPHPSGATNQSNSQGVEVTPGEPTATFKIESGDSIIMGGYTSLGEAYSYDSTITNCYSAGGLSGKWCVGGLVGYSYDYVGNTMGYAGLGDPNSYRATITSCYSTCNVSGDWCVGGLVATNNGSVSASFWDIEISERTISGGGRGKTTSEMQMASTFIDAGWDFNTPVWTIDECVDYPRLWWENYIPIADAGPDREAYAWIDGIAQVTLDGTNSYDDDGQPLTYNWNWTVDSNSFTATEPNVTIELPVGEYIIELIVNDGIDDSEPNEVVITVIEPIQSQLWIVPRVINRHSRQPGILALLRLPEGVTKDQIDSNEPLLLYPGGIEAIRQYVIQHRRRRAQQTSICAFFDKGELMNAIPDEGSVELQVVGQLKTGQYFYGTDTVRIIRRQRRPTGGSGDNQRVTVPLNR